MVFRFSLDLKHSGHLDEKWPARAAQLIVISGKYKQAFLAIHIELLHKHNRRLALLAHENICHDKSVSL